MQTDTPPPTRPRWQTALLAFAGLLGTDVAFALAYFGPDWSVPVALILAGACPLLYGVASQAKGRLALAGAVAGLLIGVTAIGVVYGSGWVSPVRSGIDQQPITLALEVITVVSLLVAHRYIARMGRKG